MLVDGSLICLRFGLLQNCPCLYQVCWLLVICVVQQEGGTA